jgi:hypothetical protein
MNRPDLPDHLPRPTSPNEEYARLPIRKRGRAWGQGEADNTAQEQVQAGIRASQEAERKKLVDEVVRELEARWAERNPGRPRPPQEGDQEEEELTDEEWWS